MKHYVGVLGTRFECDADDEQDAQKILRVYLLTYVQMNEEPFVILEEPPPGADETAAPPRSPSNSPTGA